MDNDIVCFSHLRWESAWQRPQHVMMRAARTRRVWFVEEPEQTDGDSYLALRPVADNVVVAVPMLPSKLTRPERLRTQTRLLANLFAGSVSPLPVHWYYSPLAREFGRDLQAGAIVYDCMDELPEAGTSALQLWELELLAAADLVFTPGSLYEVKRQRHSSVHKVPLSSWDRTWQQMQRLVALVPSRRPILPTISTLAEVRHV